MTHVGDALVDQLVRRGARRAYTVPGESFLPLLDAFDRHEGAQLVSTRHESGAAFMAEADAKLTGVPAVVMATRGVGASNLAIGVHTARQDSTPMIVLLGQVETSYLGREAFQEVDLPAFYGELTKWAETVTTPARLPESLDRAWHAATSGRPGPVMLALPADVLDGELPEGDAWRPSVAEPVPATLPTDAVEQIVERLQAARAPVIIAGGGAQAARDELIALAEASGSGVYASFRRQDVFPNEHPHYCGHLALGPPPETLAALQTADVVLVAGSRLSEITTQSYTLPSPGAWVAQLDCDPHSVGAVLPVDVGAAVDVRSALAALTECARAHPTPPRDWSAAHDAYLSSSSPERDPHTALEPQGVMRELAAVFPADTIMANDAGNFSAFGHRYWRFRHPRSQLGSTNGAMGYGVPAAVAAALAAPHRDVVGLVGDGGFLMTGQEIETAVRHRLDLTVVVFRNGLYGTIALHQMREVGRTSAVTIGDVDIRGLAQAYGAAAWRVEAGAELAPALEGARAYKGPAVVDVLVDPDVLSPSVHRRDLQSGAGQPRSA